MMTPTSSTSERQLARQRSWLGESWSWLLRTRVLGPAGEPRPTALDVGCGPGLVMDLLSPLLDVEGVDIDPRCVRAANNRGHRAAVGRAEALPYEDCSFDIVYCSFLLLWVRDPVAVIRELKRVSRRWIVCLAEPDHGGRISYPESLAPLDDWFVAGLRRQGADPLMGRKLQGSFVSSGLLPEVGVHPGMWDLARTGNEYEEEWASLAPVCAEVASQEALGEVRTHWDRAARDGKLVQFTPTFYALARKGSGP